MASKIRTGLAGAVALLGGMAGSGVWAVANRGGGVVGRGPLLEPVEPSAGPADGPAVATVIDMIMGGPAGPQATPTLAETLVAAGVQVPAAAGAPAQPSQTQPAQAQPAPASAQVQPTLRLVGADESVRLERERVSQIDQRAAMPGVAGHATTASIRSQAIAEGWTPEQFGDRVMRSILARPIAGVPGNSVAAGAPGAGDQQPGMNGTGGPGSGGTASVQIGFEQRETLANAVALGMLPELAPAAVQALSDGRDPDKARRVASAMGFNSPAAALQAIQGTQRQGLGRGNRAVSMSQIATMMVVQSGLFGHGAAAVFRAQDAMHTAPYDVMRILQAAGGGGGHSPSDFGLILGNSLNRALQANYALYTPAYDQFCSVGSNRDYRAHDLLSLSNAPTFVEIKEGGAIPLGTWSERREQVSVAAFGRGVKWSYQLMINDDMGLLAQIAASLPATAAMVPDRLVVDLLGANSYAGPLMSDAANLFSSGHKNIITQATLSYDAVRAARQDMAKNQADFGNGLPIDVDLRVLVTGPDRMSAAEDIATQDYVPFATTSGNNRQTNERNTLRGIIQPVVLRLTPTGGSAIGNRWWLFTRPGPGSAIEVRFLNGQRTPNIFVPPQTDPFAFDLKAWMGGVGVAARNFETACTNAG